MNTSETHTQKPDFLDRLSDFLTRHRTVIVVFLIVIAVAVLALFIALEINSNRTERALVMVEDLEISYTEWLQLEEEARPAEYDAFAAEVEEILNSYPRSYATQRAIFIDGQALLELERWQDASQRFLEVNSRFPDSYLAPISLTLAAVAAENAGDPDEALRIYTLIVETQDSESAEVPRALFAIGRINEEQDNVAEAAEVYNRLVDDHPSSSWTNIARDRIITLTVQGRIGS